MQYNESVEPNDSVQHISGNCWEMLGHLHTILQKTRWCELSRPVYIVKPPVSGSIDGVILGRGRSDWTKGGILEGDSD